MTSHPFKAPDISGLRMVTFRAPGAPSQGYELAYTDAQETALCEAAKARGLLVGPTLRFEPNPYVHRVMDDIRRRHH